MVILRRIPAILALTTLSVSTRAATLRAEVTPRQCTVGDRVTVVVEIDSEPGEHVGELHLGELGEDLHLAEHGRLVPAESASGAPRWRAEIVPFAVGMLDLPPISATVTGADSATSEATADLGQIQVDAVIPEGLEPPGPKAPHGPFTLPEPRPTWPYLALLGAVVACALIHWLVRRLRQEGEAPPRPAEVRPPHEIALADLDALEASSLVAEQRYRVFFYSLTDIVRVYFEREFGLGAPEMTTQELLDALRQRGYPAAICEQVQRWITACDLVKYASQRPAPDHCRTALTLARAIVTSAHQHFLALRDASPPSTAEATAQGEAA
ncbi:hypothetical protein JXA47_12680 [Candidatus Sumerlaeota bacterium]|nr:hypothetical protein [Candidatus Sumerlaeota bacterium]